ncbi:hypothetical protein LPB88_22605 [Flavobacterium sp. JAS]|nr:hypothetical protein [Flavobacterium sp. JAS]
MPVAVIAMGIAGAFATMSMQSSASSITPKMGFTLDAQGACNIPVSCDTQGTQICRLNGDSGPQAFGKTTQGNCNQVLFRPVN